MKNLVALAFLFALATVNSAIATNPPPALCATCDASNTTSLAPSSSVNRTLGSRAGDIVNVKDFGAKGDGSTDDIVAINNAIQYIRTNFTGTTTNQTVKLYFPVGTYVVTQPVNLTGFNWDGFTVEGSGATIYGKTNGQAIVDMFGSRWIRLHGFRVYTGNTASASVGIQIGRAGFVSNGSGSYTGGQACSNGQWDDVTAYGFFTIAPIYIMACETTHWSHVHAFNFSSSSSSYALILDGVNHFNLPSSYTTIGTVTDLPISFNEPLFESLMATVTASNSSAIWLAHTQHMTCLNCYAANTGSGHGVTFYSNVNADAPTDTWLDLHMETNAITSDFFITGPNATPSFNGLHYHSQTDNATTYLFETDTGVTNVVASGFDLDVNSMAAIPAFSAPSLWTVSGRYRIPSGSTAWNLTTGHFGGVGIVGGNTFFAGDGTNVSNVSATIPANLSISTITSAGSVSSIAVVSGGHYDIDTWCAHGGGSCQSQYAHLFPLITVAGPGGSGATATAHVSSVSNPTNTVLDAFLDVGSGFIIPVAGGTGYAVNNVISMVGATCSDPPTWTVKGVSGGAVTLYTVNHVGSCQVLPSQPIAVTGGAGTGMTMGGLTWAVAAITVDSDGSGYGSTPVVTAQTSPYSGSSTATATASVSASLPITSASGEVLLDGNGTHILGTINATSAAAGFDGQLLTATLASGSATSLTTATAKNITSVSLTAGDWDCTGIVDYVSTAATTTDFKSGISTSTGAFGAQDTFVNSPLIATALSDTYGHLTPSDRFLLSTTTTIFLVGQATFSIGTETGYGSIRCRRIQ